MQHKEAVPIRTYALAEHVGSTVTLRGWLHAVRELGTITFVVIRDGWSTCQAVCSKELAAPLASVPMESIVEIEGLVVANRAAPGHHEIQATRACVLEAIGEAPPVVLSKREVSANLPTMLDFAPVSLRHPTRRAVFRLSAAVMAGFRHTLAAEGFTEVQTPKLVESATEGGSNVFEVEYFGRKAYLAQSPQFYKQTMVGVFERVFEVGPVFRAEPHATSRHINEYVSLDVEMGFIESHRTVMAMLRHVLAGIVETLEGCQAELELLGIELPEVPTSIVELEFAEAKRIAGGELSEPDLSPAEERAIGAWAEREHNSAFVFVTGYPLEKRPFYTQPSTVEGASNSFDLLFRGTELVTGGQRLHRYEDYLSALAARGLSPEPFEGYLQAFKYGMPPHGGFAIGLERFLMQMLAASNIREVTLFPRDIHRLSP